MSNEPEFDRSAIESLRDLGELRLIREMVELALENIASRLADARRGIADANLEVVRNAAHAMISSAGNVGAVRVEELARQLEAVACDGRHDTVPELIGDLEQAFATVKPLVESVRDDLEQDDRRDRGQSG